MLKNNIKKILDIQGRKAKYLSNGIGITQSHLTNIMNGKTKPNVELVLKMAKVLNVKVEAVFYVEENE